MDSVKVWTDRLIGSSCTLLFLFLGVYLAALIITAFDLQSICLPREGLSIPYVFATCMVLFSALVLFWKVVLVCFLRHLWRAAFPASGHMVPALFWMFLIPLAGDVLAVVPIVILAWRRGRGVFALSLFWGLLDIVGILLRWLEYAFCFALFGDNGMETWFGNLTAFPILSAAVLLFLVPDTALFLLLVPWIAEQRPAWKRLPVLFVFALFLLSIPFSFCMMAVSDARTERLKSELRARGVPLDPADFRKRYAGKTDGPWSSIVDQWDASRRGKDSGMSRLLDSPLLRTNVYEWTEADWDGFRAECGKERFFLGKLDAILSRSPLKYAPHFDRNMTIGLRCPHWEFLRSAARLYAARIRLALRDRNAEEAMRLFHSLSHVAETALHEDFYVGCLVGISSGSLLADAAADMLGSRLFGEEELHLLEQEFAASEALIPPSVRNAVATEAAYLDLLDVMIRTGGDFRHADQYVSSPLRTPVTAPLYCLMRGEQAFLLAYWKKIIDEMEQPSFDPLGKNFTTLTPEERRGFLHGRIFLPMLFPEFPRLWDRAFSLAARLRMGRIACRVAQYRLRHGTFPEDLADLRMKSMPTDPFTGKPFFYTRGTLPVYDPAEGKCMGHVTGFRLHGTGSDRKDDSGFVGRGLTGDDVFLVPDPDSFVPEKK